MGPPPSGWANMWKRLALKLEEEQSASSRNFDAYLVLSARKDEVAEKIPRR